MIIFHSSWKKSKTHSKTFRSLSSFKKSRLEYLKVLFLWKTFVLNIIITWNEKFLIFYINVLFIILVWCFRMDSSDLVSLLLLFSMRQGPANLMLFEKKNTQKSRDTVPLTEFFACLYRSTKFMCLNLFIRFPHRKI